MEIDLSPVHADIGDDAARRHNVLTEQESCRHADGLDRSVHAAPLRQRFDFGRGLTVAGVDDLLSDYFERRLHAIASDRRNDPELGQPCGSSRRTRVPSTVAGADPSSTTIRISIPVRFRRARTVKIIRFCF